MDPRLLAAPSVALLVLIAGCAGGLGGQTTSTPPEEVAFPAGASENGLGDVLELRRTHAQATQGMNYRADFVVETNTTHGWPVEMDRTIHHGVVDGENVTRVQMRGDLGDEVYADARHRYERFGDDHYSYDYASNGLETPVTYPPTALGTLAELLMYGNFSYEYEGTTIRSGTVLLEYGAAGEAENLRSYTATVLVDQRGVIHAARGSFSRLRETPNTDATWQQVAFDWSLTAGVEAPARPDWTESVPHVELSISDIGRTVVLENTRGSAIPADTTLQGTVTIADGETHRTNVTLAEAVDSGESVTLSVVKTDGGYVLRTGQPSGGSAATLQSVTLLGDAGSTSLMLRGERNASRS